MRPVSNSPGVSAAVRAEVSNDRRRAESGARAKPWLTWVPLSLALLSLGAACATRQRPVRGDGGGAGLPSGNGAGAEQGAGEAGSGGATDAAHAEGEVLGVA